MFTKVTINAQNYCPSKFSLHFLYCARNFFRCIQFASRRQLRQPSRKLRDKSEPGLCSHPVLSSHTLVIPSGVGRPRSLVMAPTPGPGPGPGPGQGPGCRYESDSSSPSDKQHHGLGLSLGHGHGQQGYGYRQQHPHPHAPARAPSRRSSKSQEDNGLSVHVCLSGHGHDPCNLLYRGVGHE